MFPCLSAPWIFMMKGDSGEGSSQKHRQAQLQGFSSRLLPPKGVSTNRSLWAEPPQQLQMENSWLALGPSTVTSLRQRKTRWFSTHQNFKNNGWDTERPSSLRASQEALVVKNLPANAGELRDAGLTPGLGRSLGGANGNPLQYSCLENPMDRGAWQVAPRGHKEPDATKVT